MALAWRARAAAVKGVTLIVFALWVLGNTAWHALHGTLPQAEVMGVVGVAALIANGGVALMLYRFRGGIRICVRSGFARAMTPSATSPWCWPLLGVFGTGTGWPDMIVAAILAGLAYGAGADRQSGQQGTARRTKGRRSC